MNTVKKWVAYIVYILALALLFLYVLFPHDAFRRYIEFKANHAVPEFQLGIGQLSLGFPPGAVFQQVDLKYSDLPSFRIDQAIIRPVYLSMLGSKRTFDLDGDLFGGTLVGKTQISGLSGKQPNIDAQFSLDAIELDAVPAIEQMIKHRLSGELAGTIDYAGGIQQIGTGSAQLTLADFGIEFDSPVFGIESLIFSRISANLDIQNRRVTLKECNFRGNQVSGNGSGNLTLAMPLENSRINLTGTLTPHPSLLKTIGGLIPKRYLSDGRVPIRISGTLRRPRISMQ